MRARLLSILVCTALLTMSVGQVHAVLGLQGEECIGTECFYEDPRLQNGLGSLTAVPRFYHMAQQCYLQAAMLGTINYYNSKDAEKWTPTTTGVAQTWQLDSFCLNPVMDGEQVLNDHVILNVKKLYERDNISSPLQGALKNFDVSLTENPEQVLASLSQQSPELLVSDILWREYLSYSKYLDKNRNRTPDDFKRATVWANSDALSRTGGSGVWTSFLQEQVDLVSRLDATADKQIALATRYVAEIMYNELLRTYAEHLQYLKMRDYIRDIAEKVDRMQRALTTLSIKLPDAYIIGN